MRIEASKKTQTGALLAGNGLDRCFHGSVTAFDQSIGSEGLDLVSFQFGVLSGCSQADGTSGRIDGTSDRIRHRSGITKQLPHHQLDIVVRMIVVIPQNDVVLGLSFSIGLVSRCRRFLIGNRLLDSDVFFDRGG